MSDEWWGTVGSSIASGLVVAVVTACATWALARRKRPVWVLEHVRDEEWTLTYRGRRPAWDVGIGQTLTSANAARQLETGTALQTVFADWVKGNRHKVKNFARGEELTLRWHDRGRRLATVQTRESQSRYEVLAGEVRRDAPAPMAR